MTTAATKKKKKMKGRPRGGASHPCPECGSDTHVITTRREASGSVTRHRQCTVCEHKFYTSEEAVYEQA